MIFINIACYNDLQIYETIQSLWQNSDDFFSLKIGICWQSDKQLNLEFPNIQILSMPLLEAKGVGYARALAHTLWAGEPYYLLIDSHTLFSKSWDTRIVNHFNSLQKQLGEKVLISSYAPGWGEYPEGKARKLITRGQFNQFGVLRFRAGEVIQSDLVYPPISCHFMFSSSQFFFDLPPDPAIFYNGEEISYTVRAFTHGWTNVQPGAVYLFHKYNDPENGHPTIWKINREWQKLNNPSILRVKQICSHEPDHLGKYGKGKVKSLSELEKLLRIDFKSKRVL